MQQKRLFITGTDTEVGKTFFTTALIHALQQAGHSLMAFKPVAAGCELIDGELKNEDALAIIKAMNNKPDYPRVNPLVLKAPIAPHIAAAQQGVSLSVKKLQSLCPLDDYSQEYLLIEGAGGWLVPLNEQQTLADYVQAESSEENPLEVILVVGMKLGCINHALLTQQSIQAMGLKLAGWVANHIDPQMQEQQKNIETLTQRLDCPLLAQIPYLQGDNLPAQASSYVRMASLS